MISLLLQTGPDASVTPLLKPDSPLVHLLFQPSSSSANFSLDTTPKLGTTLHYLERTITPILYFDEIRVRHMPALPWQRPRG